MTGVVCHPAPPPHPLGGEGGLRPRLCLLLKQRPWVTLNASVSPLFPASETQLPILSPGGCVCFTSHHLRVQTSAVPRPSQGTRRPGGGVTAPSTSCLEWDWGVARPDRVVLETHPSVPLPVQGAENYPSHRRKEGEMGEVHDPGGISEWREESKRQGR